MKKRKYKRKRHKNMSPKAKHYLKKAREYGGGNRMFNALLIREIYK